MALPASGAITFGNINTELGYSATAQIALNDAAVRTLAGVASGAIAMSNLYGKANEAFGIGILSSQIFTPNGGNNYEFSIQSTYLDSSGNLYIGAYHKSENSNSFSNGGWLAKVSPTGSVLWQKRITSFTNNFSTGYGTSACCVAIRPSSAGGIYVCVMAAGGGQFASNGGPAVFKFASDGTVTWKKEMGSNYYGEYVSGMDVDTSENIYLSGNWIFPPNYANSPLTYRINSSGDKLNRTQHPIAGPTTFNRWTNRIAQGTSGGQRYAIGYWTSSNYGGLIGIKRVDEAAQFPNTEGFASPDAALLYAADMVDTSGSIYGCSNFPGGGSQGVRMWKFAASYYLGNNIQSSQTCDWKRVYTKSGVSNPNKMTQTFATDTSTMLYHACDYDGVYIFKHNTSGTLQFVRKLSHSTGSLQLNNGGGIGNYQHMSVRNDKGIALGMRYTPSNLSGTIPYIAVFCKLPSDGSKTGSYVINNEHTGNVTFTYAVESGFSNEGDPGYSYSWNGYSWPQFNSSNGAFSITSPTTSNSVVTGNNNVTFTAG